MSIKNDKHRKFAEEYVLDLNGARAYREAYPSCKKDSTAKSNASRLLKDADVRGYVDELLARIQSEKLADATEVHELFTQIARGQPRERTYEQTVNDNGQTYTSKKVSKESPDFFAQIKALESLAKIHGMYLDRKEITGDVGVTIIDDVDDDLGGDDDD